MSDNKIFNKDYDFVIRKEPSKIFSYNLILILGIIGFLFISIFFKYSKCKNYISNVRRENDYYLFEIILSKRDFMNLKSKELIINNNIYSYDIYDFRSDLMNNNYNVFLSIKCDECEFNEYEVVVLKSKKTTLMNEILSKIKEDLKQWLC